LQKKKISDLDPKWSKDELKNFYEAYRQHGKDWKKVGTVCFPLFFSIICGVMAV
jgi:hypothetical protein